MAISKEDKKDVKGAFGKAIANKIEKVTRDYGPKASRHFADLPMKHRKKDDTSRIGRGYREMGERKYVKLKPVSRHTGDTIDSPTTMKYRAYRADGKGGILTQREKREIQNRKK